MAVISRRITGRVALSREKVVDIVIDNFTAALNWYRANAVTIATCRWAACRVPTRGVFSTSDAHLVEEQMVRSERYMNAPLDYAPIDAAGHWVPLEQPERVAALIAGWAISA